MNNLMTQSWAISRTTSFQKFQNGEDEETGGGQRADSPGMDFTKFNKATDQIEADILKARESLTSMRAIHREIGDAVKAGTVASLHKKMDVEVGAITKLAKAVNDKLKALRADNEANRKYPGCEENSATDRQRTTITHNLVLKLKELTEEFNELRAKMAEEHRVTVERRLYIVTGEEASEEDVDKIIETGQSEQILQQAVEAQGQGQVRDAILEIQERHSAVQDITRSLKELQQMFLDMAVMVEAQSEMLDNIEMRVETATDYVTKGGDDLQQAVVTQRNTRKWICYGVIAVLIAILVICIPTIASVVNSST